MTEKPRDVRMARHGDEELLFALVCASDEEWALGTRDSDKVRRVIHLACNSDKPPRPMFGVVQGKSIIEAAVGLYPTERWNSSDLYLGVFFHFVHPLHRKSRHAVHLAQFAKWMGDAAGMPVVFELLNPERTEAKMRLYGRQAKMVGGLFLHQATV